MPIDYAAVTRWVQARKRLMVVTHRRPDGDALGSQRGFANLARRLGANCDLVLYEPLPQRFASWAGTARWGLWTESESSLRRACDGLVILDTCSTAQLEPLADLLRDPPPTLVLDHHATRDPLAQRPSDLRFIDPTAAATCLLIAEWAAAAAINLDSDAATALWTGLATDCGWFRFSNTDARALQVAADLVRAGAAPHQLYGAIYEREPAAKLRLLGRLLANLELRADGRLAVMRLRISDFAAAGADRFMTDEIVNEPMRIGGVVASILCVEETDGSLRANLRSKHTLDVAALAQRFGGGGHERAAGARMAAPFEAAVEELVSAAAEALAHAPPSAPTAESNA